MIFDLPTPNERGAKALSECLEGRRSVREYSESLIPISYLSELLWSAQGVTGTDRKRATPSAGGLYPFQLRIVVRRVAELEAGIYEYDGDRHSLRLLSNQLPEADITEADIKKAGIGIGKGRISRLSLSLSEKSSIKARY